MEGELPIMEREAYFSSLRLWVQQAHLRQNLSTCMPYYLMSMHGGAAPGGDFNYQTPWPHQRRGAAPAPAPAAGLDIVQQRAHAQPENASSAEVLAQLGGYEYVVAPLHKRLAAELVDFLLLFVLKLAVTYVAVDYFHFIDVERLDVEVLTRNLEDYRMALEITSEILLLELFYRIIVCFFEAWCLSRWEPGRRRGGATPGKALLGLRVVSATATQPVPGRARPTLLVHPAHPLSFRAALARSFLKNLLISLLFPVLLLLLMFHDYRMGYDVLCNALVVEDDVHPPRRVRI